MGFTKVTDEERENLGVTGLPDTPGLDKTSMQRKLDELGNKAIDAINKLSEELSARTASANIGAEIPEDLTGVTSTKLQDILNAIAHLAALGGSESQKLEGIDRVSDTVIASSRVIPTGKAIYDYVLSLQSGDAYMQIGEYTEDGKVKTSYLPVTDNVSSESAEPISSRGVDTALENIKHKLRTIKVVVPNSGWNIHVGNTVRCIVPVVGVTSDDNFQIIGYSPSEQGYNEDIEAAFKRVSYGITRNNEIEFVSNTVAPQSTIEVVMVGILD